jgi:type I restriction enzyme R subunit
LEVHGIDMRRVNWKTRLQVLPEELQREFERRFNRAFHEHLDAGHGECLMKLSHIRSLVAEAFHYFDAKRYALGDYVIMPNHVHLLAWFPEVSEVSMKKQCASWKRVSSLAINRALGRKGHFWQGESYDHIVRSEAQFEHFRTYIAENPVKAKLREGEYTHFIRQR